MARLIALLRAVNVGGRKLPMAELRALCGELGWEDVRTYIQSERRLQAAGKPTRSRRGLKRLRRVGMEVP